MASTITVADLARSLAEVLSRVHDRGEHFIIERDGEQLATLAPVSATSSITLREVVARVGDLALPGEGFAEDLEAVQAAQPPVGQPAWRN
jgi:antitoxin (DNA-binding transcriptional repressor) of toxin-antitoxin stability system